MTAIGPPYFADERHALYAGWVAGIAMRNGFQVEVLADDGGDYTGQIILKLPLIRNGVVGATKIPASLLLTVPYPPDDWTFE